MIGIFDSGIGGLTVVTEILKINPHTDLIYLGDTARVPWGNKKPQTVRHYSQQLTRFLLAKNVSQIIVACHTASSVAMETVKKTAGSIPVIGMIEPSSQDAANVSRTRRIGVIGTKTTINSQEWPKSILRLLPNAHTYSQSCPLFVPLVEESLEDHPATNLLVKYYLSDIKEQNIDTLILACTHYPFLQDQIRNFFGRSVSLVNPGVSIAKALKPDIGAGRIELYFTDLPEKSNKFLRKITNRPNVKINSISLEEIEHE